MTVTPASAVLPGDAADIPHDDAAERAVLGAVFIDPGCAAVIAEKLVAEDFYRTEHQHIAEAILWVHRAGLVTDIVTIISRLTTAGVLDRVGGASRVSDLIDHVPDVAAVGQWADIVAARAIDRQRIALQRRLTSHPDDQSALHELVRLADGQRPWSDPQPLPTETEAVPALPSELLPQGIAPWLRDEASRAALPLEMFAAPALVTLAAVVGRSVAIRPESRDDWTVVANLWGAVVAPAGAMKTHAIGVGLRPLRRLEERARGQHEEEAARAEARKMMLEGEIAAHKKALARGVADTDTEDRLAALVTELQHVDVHERRLTTSDATVEKLGELLIHNPRGLLVSRDEVAGWLRTLERPGREGDREFYLEAWNGTGSYTVDRIGRGTLHIPAICLSVVGGIQPGKLQHYITEALDDGVGADGLLQRVQLLVWPDGLGPWCKPETWPDHEAYRCAVEVYERLAALDPAEVGAQQGEHDRLPWVRFAKEGQLVFDDWRRELEHRVRGGELDATPAYETAVSKQRSLMPALALLLELADWAGGSAGFAGGVSAHSARRAAALVEYLDAHQRKVYAQELRPGVAGAHSLLGKMTAGALVDGVTVRDIYQHGWSGLGNADAVAAALGVLERAGWVRVDRLQPAGGGRPSEVVRVHPSVRGVVG